MVHIFAISIWSLCYLRFPLRIAVALARAMPGKERTSRPLMISLTLDLLSRYLRRSPPASATIERAEYARRDRDLLWYFLRGAIWESYTRLAEGRLVFCRRIILNTLYRPKVASIVAKTSGAPILGLFSALVGDWMPLIDEYYYCQ